MTVTRTEADAHAGSWAIEVCQDNSAASDDFTVSVDVDVPAVELGAAYEGWAWVKPLPSGDEPETMWLTFRERWGSYQDEIGPSVSPLDRGWQQLTVSGTVDNSDSYALGFIVWGSDAMNGDQPCFLVDDAYLYRVR